MLNLVAQPSSWLLGRFPDTDDPERLGCALTGDRVGAVQLGGQPPREGIGAQVLLDNQPGVTARRQPGQPRQQEGMQFVFSDADGRVGPDGVELDGGVYLVREAGSDVGESERRRILVGQRDATLIHIHRMDLGMWCHQPQGEGNRTPAAADVQQVTLR